MPTGNKSITLQNRLQQVAPSFSRDAHNIVGTKEWAFTKCHDEHFIKYNAEKAQESFFSSMSHEEKQEYLSKIPRAFADSQKLKNEQFIDNITAWIDGNGWQYIEGGEAHGSWINPHYPNQTFQGGGASLPVATCLPVANRVETVEFPLSPFEDDPHGIACHVIVNTAGSRKEIRPNKWTDLSSTRRGRKQKRTVEMYNRRYSRWEQYNEANQIKDVMRRNEAIAGLKMKFHNENVKREQKKMGYTDEQIAAAN